MAAYDSFNIDEGDDINFDAEMNTPESSYDGSDEEYIDDPEDEDFDFGELQGGDDLDPNYSDKNAEHVNVNKSGATNALEEKKTRPAFYSRSVKAAERAAVRTQVNNADSFLLLDDEEGVVTAPPRRGGTLGRRSGNSGEPQAAYHKKVTVELDTDDEMIMTMRDRGFTDVQIAQRLSKDGRSKYTSKTISTRINRIKGAQAAHCDHLIEEGYKEWTHEDDLCLMQAYEFANIEVNYEIERARAWRFKKVADHMRRLDKDKIFSEKACRERFQGLMRGTARIPTDLDDDPDARRAEMEAYREERERKRAEEAAAKEEKEALERATKEEMRLRNAQKAKETALAREKKQREKAERAHKRATMNQTKLQRAQNNKARKARRFQQIREQKEAEKEDAEKRNREMNDNTPLSLKRVVELKNVTHDTPDPRSFLYFQDLQSLCLGRSLSDEAGSKEELVQRLRDDDEKVYHTVAELRRVCRNKGLNIAGTSAMLKYQLALSEAKGYASFNAVPAADDDVPMTE